MDIIFLIRIQKTLTWKANYKPTGGKQILKLILMFTKKQKQIVKNTIKRLITMGYLDEEMLENEIVKSITDDIVQPERLSEETIQEITESPENWEDYHEIE